MKELKPKHRTVAAYLALGYDLKGICENLNLNYDTWKVISNQPLFKEAIRMIQVERENALIDESLGDPVLLKLKAEALKSVSRLVEERDLFEKELGASSATRLSSAKALLEFAGYKEDRKDLSPTIILNLTQDKISAIFRDKKIEPQPDRIEGSN